MSAPPCAETPPPQLAETQVHHRTDLVMRPMRDTAQGTAFPLGEVLAAEAHIRAEGPEG